jgi:hypothetical protein
MLRKLVVVVAVVCVATSAWAGAKDKIKGSLTNNTACRGTTVWDNKLVKATYQADSKKMKLSWKGTASSLNGKQVYCFLCANSYMGTFPGVEAANCLVMGGKPEEGALKMQGAVEAISAGANPDQIQFNSTMDCYEDSAGTYVPGDNCPTPYLWLTPTAEMVKKAANIVGVCENLSSSDIPITTLPDTYLAGLGMGSFPDEPVGGSCTAP